MASAQCLGCGVGKVDLGTTTALVRAHWASGLWRHGGAKRLGGLLESGLNQRLKALRPALLTQAGNSDLLIWNLFSWLEDRALVDAWLRHLQVEPKGQATIFYWGASDRGALPLQLSQVLRGRFQEPASNHTEADIMIADDENIVLVRAEPTPAASLEGSVDRYVNAMPTWFADPALAKTGAPPDMVRLWAVGGTLSERLKKNLTLVYLAENPQAVVEAARPAFSSLGTVTAMAWTEWTTIDPALELFVGAALKERSLASEPN